MDQNDRRPLASRNTRWAARLANWLATTSITPNQVSYASIVFAVLAGICFYGSLWTNGILFSLCLFSAALCCQLRLLCNLMDGMVAIEAGKQSADGAVWNELPDRISDIAILVGAGLAISSPALGWTAATLAVLVSYVRELGKGIDAVVDFRGPMAKPQRMALITIAALIAALLPWLPEVLGNEVGARRILRIAIWLLILGSALTVLTRSRALLQRLQ